MAMTGSVAARPKQYMSFDVLRPEPLNSAFNPQTLHPKTMSPKPEA